MHLTTTLIAAVLAFGTQVSQVAADNTCAAGNAQEIAGNWYCSAVQALTYNNVGTPGSYNQVTSMGSDGSCTSTPKSFSGPLSPLDEEVSMHFRGPQTLKQFAYYSLSSTSKREVSHTQARRHAHGHGHGHAHFHKRLAEAEAEAEAEAVEKRGWVVATIDGKVVSWQNDYFGASTPVAAAPAAATKVATTLVPVVAAAVSKATSTPAAAAQATTTPATSPSSSSSSSGGAYTRAGYYNSASQTLDGLVFLGNHGGSGSGVFDTVYGMSLSYLNSAGTGGAASSQVLADTAVPSNTEFIIMADTPCANNDCGYVRPGTVAYHGFPGADKVFLMEFNMASDGSTGFNADMPAIWMLNAQIPRTLQYGSASCSCWESGCGEFDIVEVLTSGSMFCKSTFHTNTPAGNSDYLVRPTTGTMKLAVIFHSGSSSAYIQVLPASQDFPTSLTEAQVEAMMNMSTGSALSTFNLS